MRLLVALPAGTVRFWVAAAAPALAVIVGAYLLETHGRTSAAAALVAGGVAIAAGRFLASAEISFTLSIGNWKFVVSADCANRRASSTVRFFPGLASGSS